MIFLIKDCFKNFQNNREKHNQPTANQSSAAATQYTSDQSLAAVVTRRTSDQSYKCTLPATVTLPKNTKKLKQISMIKDKEKKQNAPSNDSNTNQKNGSLSQDEDKTKKEKPIRPRNGNRRIKKSL